MLVHHGLSALMLHLAHTVLTRTLRRAALPHSHDSPKTLSLTLAIPALRRGQSNLGKLGDRSFMVSRTTSSAPTTGRSSSLTDVLRNKRELGSPGDFMLTQVGQVLFVNLLIGTRHGSGIDNLGHVSGAVAGLVFGWLPTLKSR